jgi:hypothetical protein
MPMALGSRARVGLVAAALAVAALLAILLLGRPSHHDVAKLPAAAGPTAPIAPGGDDDAPALKSPFSWAPNRAAAYTARAAAGAAHVLYTQSPGGAQETAGRVAQWRPQIERAAKAAGVSADRLEGLVFLESAGRADAVVPSGVSGAAGLTQIVAETGTDLLGMHIDLKRSESYTRRIARAEDAGQVRRFKALEKARARVDDRFDPAKALAATARYLTLAKQRFGREDLAFVSYHMGIGNLQNVLADYGQGNVPYVQVYFDSTPQRNPETFARLSGFGDDSSNYLWKIGAAEQIMALYRHDPKKLARLEQLQEGSDSAELVLHPPPVKAPANQQPIGTRDGLRAPPTARLAPRALSVLRDLGREVKSISHAPSLRVISAASGWSVDISRHYASGAQAQAFQFALDRLQILNVIAWARRGDRIHITVA